MAAAVESEEVLVVPRPALVERLGELPDGFSAQGAREVELAVDESGFFLARGQAEDDPEFKQIIPYCVVTSRGLVFLMRRRGGGEARLTGKLSIGVGGHVNRTDSGAATPSAGDAPEPLVETLRRGLARELAEELDIRSPGRLACVGILNDDSNSVGQVHLGLVYRLDLDVPDADVREHDALEGGFVAPADLHDQREAMETWSSALLGAGEVGLDTRITEPEAGGTFL